MNMEDWTRIPKTWGRDTSYELVFQACFRHLHSRTPQLFLEKDEAWDEMKDRSLLRREGRKRF